MIFLTLIAGNRFQFQINASGILENMTAVKDTLRFFDTNSPITVTNKFKQYTRHEYISIFNPTAAIFSLEVQATSLDGINDMPLQEFFVDGELIRDFTYAFPFDRAKIYTITWPDDIPLTIFVGYEKMDQVGAGNGGVATSSGGRMRTVYDYHGTPEEFAADFDIATGLGYEDGIYAGCAVCDGNHDTPDLRERMILGSDGLTNLVIFPVNEDGGSWLKQIDLNNLPVMFFSLFKKSVATENYIPIDAGDVAGSQNNGASSSAADGKYRIGKSILAGEPDAGRTNKIGGAAGDGSIPGAANFSVKGQYYRLIKYKQIA